MDQQTDMHNVYLNTVSVLETVALFSTFLFGLIPAFKETKKEIFFNVNENGKVITKTRKGINRWGYISIFGAFISMIIAISIKFIKLNNDNAKEASAKKEAIEKYNKNVAFQDTMNRRTASMIDSLKTATKEQHILHALGVTSLEKEAEIIVNAERATMPIMPVRFVVNLKPDTNLFVREFKKATADKYKQLVAALPLQKTIEGISFYSPLSNDKIQFSASSEFVKKIIRRQGSIFSNSFMIRFTKKISDFGSGLNFLQNFAQPDTTLFNALSNNDFLEFTYNGRVNELTTTYYFTPQGNLNVSGDIIGIADLEGVYIVVSQFVGKLNYLALAAGLNKIILSFHDFRVDPVNKWYYHRITKEDLKKIVH